MKIRTMLLALALACGFTATVEAKNANQTKHKPTSKAKGHKSSKPKSHKQTHS
jgi:hypothetical protein